MTSPPTLADLADPGELDVSYLDCHHNTTMPVAVLLPCYAAETPFPDVGQVPLFGLWAQGMWTFGRTARVSMRACRKQAAWNDDYMLSLLAG